MSAQQKPDQFGHIWGQIVHPQCLNRGCGCTPLTPESDAFHRWAVEQPCGTYPGHPHAPAMHRDLKSKPFDHPVPKHTAETIALAAVDEARLPPHVQAVRAKLRQLGVEPGTHADDVCAEAPASRYELIEHDFGREAEQRTPACLRCGLRKPWLEKRKDPPPGPSPYDEWRLKQGCAYHHHPDYQAAQDLRPKATT